MQTRISSDDVSDRDAMFAAADVSSKCLDANLIFKLMPSLQTYFTQELHPNSMSTSKQAGLIVLDELGESLDKSWLSLLSR